MNVFESDSYAILSFKHLYYECAENNHPLDNPCVHYTGSNSTLVNRMGRNYPYPWSFPRRIDTSLNSTKILK